MFASILCPVDPSELGFEQKAVTAARQMGEAGALVTLVTVIPAPHAAVDHYLPPDVVARQASETQAAMEAIGRALGLPEGRVQIRVRHGRAANEILEEAKETGADLIVMASHRPGLATYLIGSTATHVVRHANCSVLVIREEQPAT